jgi:hypothetical protein
MLTHLVSSTSWEQSISPKILPLFSYTSWERSQKFFSWAEPGAAMDNMPTSANPGGRALVKISGLTETRSSLDFAICFWSLTIRPGAFSFSLPAKKNRHRVECAVEPQPTPRIGAGLVPALPVSIAEFRAPTRGAPTRGATAPSRSQIGARPHVIMVAPDRCL